MRTGQRAVRAPEARGDPRRDVGVADEAEVLDHSAMASCV